MLHLEARGILVLMDIKVRNAVNDDGAAIISLMRDFAAFERLSDFFTITEEMLVDALFGDTRFVEALVAEADGAIAAYAIFYPNFSSFRGQTGYYLEDLYIGEKYRGCGLGEAMLREIAKLGAARGLVRIDFQVLNWNKSAIGFYKSLGGVVDDDERHFKFTDEAFKSLVK